MRKLLLLLVAFLTVLSIHTKAQTTVTVGTNASTVNYFPNYYLYDYTYSQTIYTAVELTGASAPTPGYINKIRYYAGTTAATTNWKDWVIYLGNTTKEGFSGTADFIPPTSMTEVFNGVIDASTTANSWLEITLTTPFLWDGASNLVVAIDENTPTYGNSPTWKGYTLAPSSGSKGIYFYQDATDVLPASPSASSSGAVNLVAQIQFEMSSATPCSGMPTAGSATSSVLNGCSGTPFNLSLTGQTQASGLAFQWQSGATATGPWANISGANTLNYSTSQTANTWYRCRVSCGTDTANSDAVEVITPALVGGTYTIDNALPTGGGNFASFADALSYIACGINAPVVFNVASGSGPYLERLVLNHINGASATNTITFNGNGATLQYSATGAADRVGIHLNGADHIIIDSLIIDGSAGAQAWGIVLTNQADSNIIRKSTINVGMALATSNFAGIVINGSTTGTASAGNNGNGNLIENNTIIGGYYGMYLYGSSTLNTNNNNNRIINNSLQDFYYYGVYAIYQSSGFVVSKNEISRPTRPAVPTSAYGIYVSTGSVGVLIEKNRINNMFGGIPSSTNACYGIGIATDGTITNPTRVENNAIYNLGGNGTLYGLYNSGGDYMKAYHNTISLDNVAATAGTTYGFYQVTNVPGIEFKNNIVNITRGGSGVKYCIYKSTAATPIVSNNNVLYVNSLGGGAQNIGYQTSAQATLLDWQTASSQDASSLSVDPLFTDPTTGNYLFTESSIDDKGAAVGVLTDILDSSRSVTTPDPGAWEVPPVMGIDIKPDELVSPIVNAQGCYNTETLTVKVTNNGTQDINFTTNQLTVTVNVTGAATASYSAIVNTGSLLAGASQNITMTTPSATLDMSVAGVYNFAIETNLVGDINPINNTTSNTREKIALSGGTATLSQHDLCVSGIPPTLSATTVTGYTGVQWQSSTTTGTGFTDIVGADTITYTLPSIPLTAMYYRLVATCGTSTNNSTEDSVTVNDPQLASTTPGSRCGTGTVDLAATATSGYTVNWYADSTGGSALASGNTFTTPIIAATTTFYAAASTGPGGPSTVQIGNGTSTSTSYESPYYHLYGNKLSQYLFLASELTAEGMTAGNINSIAFDVVVPGTTYNNFSIALKGTSASAMTSSLESGLSTVYTSASETPVAGINTYTFNVPFVWDGVSNVIVQVCWGNNNSGGTNTSVKYNTTAFASNAYYRVDGSMPVDFCSSPTATSTTSNRPNAVFGFSNVCEGIRTPVIATVNTAPAITVTATNDSICLGSSTTLNVSSSNSNYTYTWSPISATGASATVNPTENSKYFVNAYDAGTTCAQIDSITIVVNPVPSAVTVVPSASTICANTDPAISLTITGGTIGGNAAIGNGIVQNGTNSTTNMPPYGNYYTGNKHQILITAAELTAAGLLPNSNITELAFDVISSASGTSYKDFVIKIGHTGVTGLTTTFEPSPSLEVFNSSLYTPSPGWSTHPFTTPFVWDGTSNILVETYFSNCGLTTTTCSGTTCSGSEYTTNAVINQTTTSFVSHSFYYSDGESCNIGSTATASTAVSVRPNIQFAYSIPTNVTWSPTTELFTDAAATIPYTGTAESVVYAKPTVTRTYTATATTTDGCSATGDQTIVSDCSVPVTFTSFTGKKEGSINILNWTTATEINNLGYELQRSADGRSYSKIDFISTKAINGNSNTPLSYTYQDLKPLTGNNYYRLKQLDKDGKTHYSNVVNLKGDKATQVNITGVYPNPTRNTLNVSIASPSVEKVSIVITDISGKVLIQQSVVLNSGDNVQTLDVSNLSQGTYLIKTICNNGCESAVIKFAKY
jgi:hypothetical protein